MYQKKGSKIWYISYPDGSGKTICQSSGTTSKRQAQELEKELRREAAQRKLGEYANSTVDQLVVYYLDSIKEKRAYASYRSRAKHVLRYFGGRKISDIKRHDVLDYIATRKKENASPATINHETGLLSAAIKLTNLNMDCDIRNPCQQVKQKEPDGRKVWITKAEAAKLVEEARKRPKQLYLAPLIILALHTGMRRNELLSLEWSDVDLSLNLINLRSENTKTNTARVVPLNPDALAALRELKGIQSAALEATSHIEDDEKKALYRHVISTYVFSNPNNKTGHITEPKRAFNSARNAAGIPAFHLHDCRHTCATWLLNAGIPIQVISKILGHKTTYMTERYAHLDNELTRQAIQKISSSQAQLATVHSLNKQTVEKW